MEEPTKPGTKTSVNAFETLKLLGLSSTTELRKVNEHARVRQAMGGSEQPDDGSATVERLFSDPVYRVRQAAAWYFRFGTATSAAASDGGDQVLHDKVLLQWHRIVEGATAGSYDPDQFDEACESTTELLNNPMAWQPLDHLVQEIGDPRLGPGAVPLAATEAAATWICKALFVPAVAGTHENARDAGDAVVAEGLPDDVVDAVTILVLKRAADELTAAATENETRVGPLIERIEVDPSLASGLRAAAQDLVAAARPWWALVDVFDEDPDSGAEGHALDRVARLLRGAAVALFNHTDDDDAAESLLGFACEIGQSASLKSSLEEEHRMVLYRIAVAKAIGAVKAGEVVRAKAYSLRATGYVRTAAEHTEAAKLSALVARMEVGERVSIGASAGTSGCGSIVGALGALIVVGLIAVASVNGAGSSDEDTPVKLPDPNIIACALKGSELDNSTVALDALERQLDSIKARYSSLQLPDSAYFEYTSLVNRYEARRGPHNNLVREYKSQCR